MSKRTLIFDTETTSLIKNSAQRLDKQPHIIEFFGLTLNEELEEVEVWQSLFSHHKPLPEDTIRITGITDDIIAGAPFFFTKAEEIKAHIESHDCVAAHNLNYDMSVVDFEMDRANLKVNWPEERICTVEQTEYLKGFRLSLTALHVYLFEEEFKNAHRAEGDVRALTKCFIKLKERGDL